MVAENSLIKYAKKLENSEIIVEDGLGHLMHEENPNKIFEHLMCFYNKIENTKLYTRATKEVKAELNCSHCDSQIYPALWTDEIDRIYLYNLKRIGNPQTYQRFKPLAIFILVGIVLAGAAAAFGIYYLKTR